MDGQGIVCLLVSSHFLKHAVSAQPLLLLLDGHSSHFTINFVQAAAEHDAIVLCLPPHTTSDSQPLDTSCYCPLKVYWSEACQQYICNNPGRCITKFQFSKLFSQAWSKGMTIQNITSGFCQTGILNPFNPEIVLDHLLESNMKTPPNGDKECSTVRIQYAMHA